MVSRFKGSGREQEGGFLATHKQDFNAHVTGGDWRHGALDIDMEPVIPALGGATVQRTLEQMAAFLSAQGSGFISIGKADGYDGYSAGVYNVGSPATPTLSEAFAAAFADARLQNGGVVLLLSGTYELLTTVEVPPGITIMGELAGSIIISHATNQSMFKILAGEKNIRIGGDSGSGTIRLEAGDPLDATTFWNLILADNLDGYVTQAGQPVSVMTTDPMIDCEISSNFVAKDCRFIGRVNNGPVTGRLKTQEAIGGYTAGGGVGTRLTVENCFFDGMKRGISFTPGNGDIDHFTVDKCRARTFGTENIADIVSFDENCFARMSLCNGNFTNNHIVTFSDFPDGVNLSAFVISALGAGGTDVLVKLIGNTGGSSLAASSLLFTQNAALSLSSIKTVQYGNLWGSSVATNWFVTVGVSAASFTDARLGDFMGVDAIDLLFNANFQYPTTVIVNEGTYNVTSSGSKNYNFIGNGRGTTLPILDLQITSTSVDYIGNRFLELGRKIEGIHFRSDILSTSNYHSVRPGGTDGVLRGVFVKDCKFENVTLSVASGITSNDSLGSGVAIKNTLFLQTDDFADNFSILIPPADQVLLEGCKFRGAGYAGFIGSDGIFGFSGHTVDRSVVALRNCHFSKDGFTIDDAPLLSLFNIPSYLLISDASNIELKIEGCQFVVSDDLSENTAVYNVSRLTGTPSPSFIFISCLNVYIDSCLFNTPTQSFNFSAADWLLPGVHLFSAQESIRITNCKFVNGSLPLQVGSTTSSFAAATAEGLFVSGCSFYGSTTLAGSHTLVDVDLDPQLSNEPHIVSFTDCRFIVDGTTNAGSIRPRHSVITSVAVYNAQGIVQIFAEDCDVYFKNCAIRGLVDDIGSFSFGAGLVVDNTNNGAASSTSVVDVSGNHISVDSVAAPGSLQEGSAAAHIRGISVHIHNNTLQLFNVNSVSNSAFNALQVENRQPSGGAGGTPTLITGNVFSRSNLAGQRDDFFQGYIYILGGTELDGLVVNNTFSEPTESAYDNNESAIFTDDISIASVVWEAFNNKNQTVIIELSDHGWVSLIDSSLNSVIVRNGNSTIESIGAVSASAVDTLLVSANQEAVRFIFDGTDSVNSLRWIINLTGVLPLGVKIIEASVDYTSNVAGDGAPDTFQMQLARNTVSLALPAAVSVPVFATVNTMNLTDDAGYTIPAVNSPNDRLRLSINVSAFGISTIRTIRISAIRVTYRW